jgi:hypothetical protein
MGRSAHTGRSRPRKRRRWPVPVLAVLAALTIIPACTTNAPLNLILTISGLPPGVHGSVSISGPDNSVWHLTQSADLLGVDPGTYKVVAHSVPGVNGSFWPTLPAFTVRMPQQSGAALVNYGDFVPDTTRVVPRGATQELSDQSGDPQLVLSLPRGDTPYRVGDVLASGPSDADPNGYLVKVDRIEPSAPGMENLQVSQASLLDAFPEAELDVPETPLASVGISKTFAPTSLCSGTASVTASGSFAATPSFSLRVGWSTRRGLRRSKSILAELHASLSATVTATIEATAKAECTTGDPGVPLLPPGGIRPGPIIIAVGPVPVVIVPSFQVYLTGSASVEGAANATVSQQIGLSVDLQTVKPRVLLAPRRTDNSSSPSVQGYVTATAGIWITPTVDLTLYGLVGPTFYLGAGVNFTVTPLSPPQWELAGCLKAGGFLRIPLLQLKTGNVSTKPVCKVLWTRGT